MNVCLEMGLKYKVIYWDVPVHHVYIWYMENDQPYYDSAFCVFSCAGARTPKSAQGQYGGEGLCESVPGLHVQIHFWQLSRAVQPAPGSGKVAFTSSELKRSIDCCHNEANQLCGALCRPVAAMFLLTIRIGKKWNLKWVDVFVGARRRSNQQL